MVKNTNQKYYTTREIDRDKYDVSENTIRIMIPKIETRICTDWISDSSIDRNGSRNRPMLSHFEEKSIYKAKTSWEMIIQTIP
ncbi:hypothetical protein V1478_000165 [Vespula squamosa]|uniref:Uncharacterized protein n=1 Tax=Vespula squamosa TaxID=30214 RepID=A0ABD2C917_VESSQ